MTAVPNPKRVLAGARNRALRGGVSDETREWLRLLAIQNQPWTASTGPRTTAGKARVANNGRSRQSGAISKRQMRADLAAAKKLIRDMKRLLASGD